MANFTIIKICVLGVTGVGKTCIAERYVQDTFLEKAEPTVGAAYMSRYCSAPGGTMYKFHIWDTAGQERYKTLVPLYYRGASVILIVYDITDQDSFVRGAKEWVNEIQQKVHENPLLVVVGNKLDLAPTKRSVTEEEGRSYAEKVDALFFETSAKTGENITNIFHDIAAWLENRDNSSTFNSRSHGLQRTDTVKLTKRDKYFDTKKEKSGCCST